MELNIKGSIKEKLLKIKLLIVSDLRHHYTIPYLSGHFKINENHLKIGFKQLFGLPLFEFLTDQRMILATELLESGFRVSEVGTKIGYKYATNFVAAFHRHYGMTPRQWKNKNSITNGTDIHAG